MFRLLDILIDPKYSIVQKVTFLKTFTNGSFTENNGECADQVTRKIKALLSSPTERTDGLLLLKTYLLDCSSNAFMENASSWAFLTLKVIKGSDSIEDKRVACCVFLDLLPRLSSFPSSLKEITSSVAPALLDAVLRIDADDEWFEEGLELLVCCMKTFPGTCGSQKINIENFILKHLDLWHDPYYKSLACCVSLLPWCGGGGQLGSNHISAWTMQIDNLLNSLDLILDHLYHGANINEEGSVLLLSSLELPSVSSKDPLLAIYSFQKQYEFLGLSLLEMLSNRTSVSIPIPVDEILSFIWKSLSVNAIEMLSKPSIDALAIASIIPTLHCVALSVLKALISVVGRHLAMHADAINHFLLQSLSWTAEEASSYGVDRPFSAIRVQTYEVLQAWVQTCGPSAAVHQFGDTFVTHFFSDLKAEKDTVQLISVPGMDNPRGKKRKRKHHADVSVNALKSAKNHNLLANQDVCLAALNALKSVLYASGCFLEVEILKQIHSIVIRLLADLQQQAHCIDPSVFTIPYSNASCREKLYSVLMACVLNGHPLWPPPLQPSVVLFKRGLVDPSLTVSAFCTENLAIISNLLNPSVSILHHTIQQVETSPTPKQQQRIAGVDSRQNSPLPHRSQQDAAMEEEEEVEFTPTFHQVVSSSKKWQSETNRNQTEPSQHWKGEEVRRNTERPRHPPSDTPRHVATPPIPAQPQIPHLAGTSKNSTPCVASLLIKSQAPQVVPQPPFQVQPAPEAVLQRPTRGPTESLEEVVLLSEEEEEEEESFTRASHMENEEEEEEEEGEDDEEEEEGEEDEEEEEGDEQEEDEGFYPQVEENDDGYQVIEKGYYQKVRSSSGVPTSARSTEDSSSTGLAVSSIMGSLVSEAVSSSTSLQVVASPVQKARRTGIPMRLQQSAEILDTEVEEDMPLDDPERNNLEEEGEYIGDVTYEEGEEEEEEGEYEDIEEIQQIEEEELEKPGGKHWVPEEELGEELLEEEPSQLLLQEQDDFVPEIVSSSSVTIVSSSSLAPECHVVNAVTEEPVPADYTNLQILKPGQDSVEYVDPHSEGTMMNNYCETSGTTMLDLAALNSSGITVTLLKSPDHIPDTTDVAPDSDVIDLSDSPLKECQKKEMEHSVTQVETCPVEEPVETSPQLTTTDGNREMVEADPVDTGEVSEPEVLEIPEIVTNSEVVNDLTPVKDNSVNKITHDTEINDIEMPGMEIISTTENGSEPVSGKTLKEVNHSKEGRNNCDEMANHCKEELEEQVVSSSGVSNNKRGQCSPPISPQEPAAKKVCAMIQEKEEEEEEHSPTVEEMIQDFVCIERKWE